MVGVKAKEKHGERKTIFFPHSIPRMKYLYMASVHSIWGGKEGEMLAGSKENGQ